ncbi:MAG: FecR domain-containing protein [Odoribacteraceae bacterium]|jgi:ferric-dicitrate binding protein FerR (iron transport regulator)|nr:FecR domain-containing protein [Odoribacteraceae bacterium]
MDEQIEKDILDGLQGKATDRQTECTREWVEASEENREEHARYSKAYYQAKHAEAWDRVDEEDAEKQLRGERRARRVRVIARRLAAGAAALAALALLTRVEWDGEKRDALASRGGTGEVVLVLHDGSKMTLGGAAKVEMGYARAEEDSASGLTYAVTGEAPEEVEYNTLVVPRGGAYAMTFSDGTRARVNAGSSVRYPVVFGRGSREIRVEGEIYLEVQRDASRPFVVHTARAETRVTGTSFNVMAYGDDAATEVTLESGAVTVIADGESFALAPGEQVVVDHDTGEGRRRKVRASYYTSWKEGLFDFEEMPLEELCARLGRWYDVEFRFVGESARRRAFTGAVKRDNSLRFMLDFIERTSDARFRARGGVIEVYETEHAAGRD